MAVVWVKKQPVISLDNLPDEFLENVLPRSQESPDKWHVVATEIFRRKLEALEKRLCRYGRVVVREDLLPHCRNLHQTLVMSKDDLLTLADSIITRGYRH